jgi:hypothetical protein
MRPRTGAETGQDDVRETSDRRAEPTAVMERVRGWLTRPIVAALVLLAVYGALTLVLNDPRGTLGTDTGGKLATLQVMDQRGSLLPDVGYWAARYDPHATLHPLFYTYDVGGHWVNVTTLPMIYAALPLYHLGGPRLVLLLPMLGALLCAFGARALARRIGGGSGWPAFWVVGLTTPVAIYALDFWEHSIGLGLMLWGVVHLWDLAGAPGAEGSERGVRGGWWSAALAGACFGLAATMRTEALVYLVVAGSVACLTLLVRRRAIVAVAARGLTLLAAAGVVLGMNDLLERAVLGTTLRASRAASTADGIGTSLATRVQEAFTTTLGLNAFSRDLDFLVGALVVALLAYGAWRLRRGDEVVIGWAVIAVAVVLYALRFSTGLGFVPGVLTAWPFAACGLVLGWRRDLRLPVVIALVALPVVWAFQYSGGAGPQWGGRYELLTGVLLAIVGVVAVQGSRRAFAALVVVSVLVTGFGLAWLSVRSHNVANGIETIVARHDEAVISGEAHILREGGAFYDPGSHWLTTTNDAQLRRAVKIVAASGDHEFAYVVSDGSGLPRTLGGFRRTAVEKVAFLRPDIFLTVATFKST